MTNTMTNDQLLLRMKENLEKIYDEDPDLFLDQSEQYLLEKVNNFEDLWHFLNETQSIEVWDNSELYGFILCLVSDLEPGFDPDSPLSDDYHNAKSNVEAREQLGDPDIYSHHPTFYNELTKGQGI